MSRSFSHSQGKEAPLENILGAWRIRKISKYIPKKSRVLDLGCGYSGNFLKMIEPEIGSAVGIDISVDKNKESEKIGLIEHDLNQPLPFPDSEFDIVTSLANLEHLDAPDKCFAEVYRVLKPGGKLLLTAPSTFGKPVIDILAFIGLVSKQEIKDHKHYFNKKSLTELSRQTGFSKCRHQYFQLGMNNFIIATR